jgi:hypothetical protein
MTSFLQVIKQATSHNVIASFETIDDQNDKFVKGDHKILTL